MKKNEGLVDRSIRVALGVFILAIGAIYGSPLALIGLIPLATAGIGFCPLYRIFGLNTCGGEECEPA